MKVKCLKQVAGIKEIEGILQVKAHYAWFSSSLVRTGVVGSCADTLVLMHETNII